MATLRYHDFRLGYPVIIVALILEIICVHSIITSGPGVINVFFLFVVLVLGAVFISYKLEVTDSHVITTYGIGLLESEIELHEIISYHIGSNRNPVSWIYNPLGDSSLRVKLRDGSVVSFSTNDPKQLQLATQSRVNKLRDSYTTGGDIGGDV